MNFAAPRAGFAAAAFDKLFESFQIAFDPRIDKSERAADILKKSFGFIFHTQSYLRLVGALGLKTDGSGVMRAGCAAPGYALVGRLFGNIGVPLDIFHSDIGSPMRMTVAFLLNRP